MEVAYLFRENNRVRIPFFGANDSLFKKLTLLGGVWDAAFHGFVFNKIIEPENITGFTGVVCVITQEQGSLLQYKILGFWERAWEKEEDNSNLQSQNQKKEDINQLTCFPKNRLLKEKLSDEWINKIEIELRSRKYSVKTRNSYVYFNRLLCRTLQKIPEEITSYDITLFLAFLEKNHNYSASSINNAISAFKFFFSCVVKKNIVEEQQRPNQDKSLPIVLSKEEIVNIINLEKNTKHRLLIILIYSSGLRVSEVVALKKEHIDFSRQLIYIRMGKGRKDRYTMLSEKASQYLRDYYKLFGIEKWIFPGQESNRHLSIRSAQSIFKKAVQHAGIKKKVTIHGLRHSFATHLLESGTDIRYIQSLLGHSCLRTTERYTHVAKRNILKIKSPFDNL